MELLDKLPWNRIVFPKLGIELDVKSDAFTVGSLTLKWYGIIIAAGLLLALIYCFGRMKEFGLDGDKVIDTVFAGIIGAIICARGYYVIFNIDSYHDIKEIFNIRNGGLAIYGGLMGALLFGCITALIKKIKLPPLLDIACLGFLIGQGIGRWGNFFNHECFGINTEMPWGMSSGRIQSYLMLNADKILIETGNVVNPYLPVHPCFLYESLWCLLGFFLLHLYSKKRKYDGEMFIMYTGWYGFERMLVEGLRTDSLFIGPIKVSQLLAAVLFAVSLVLFIVMRVRIAKKGAPVLYVNTEESKAELKAAEEREQEEIRKAKEKKMRKKGEDVILTAEQRIIDDEDDAVPENTEKQEEN